MTDWHRRREKRKNGVFGNTRASQRNKHPNRTDDCGFSPYFDDTSTGRDIAAKKIRAGGRH
jgi:hypothetical protein